MMQVTNEGSGAMFHEWEIIYIFLQLGMLKSAMEHYRGLDIVGLDRWLVCELLLQKKMLDSVIISCLMDGLDDLLRR
jgi:hypothetical protein